jgi:hypothetical protein
MTPAVRAHPGTRTTESEEKTVDKKRLAHPARPHSREPRPPKLYACSGCGRRFPRRELCEVGPEEASWSLTVRKGEGDPLCEECAANHGVL